MENQTTTYDYKNDPTFTQMPPVTFLTGIGTDVGKSYATGWLARELAAQEGPKSVITQKFIQTGNHGSSEDIELHRKIMGTGPLPEDLDHTTAPIILSYPCSPDLAAKIDHTTIDLSLATKATEKLLKSYRHVIVEGAGGILVPINGFYTTIDYVAEQHLPAIVVTNGQLGSINHALLTLEALQSRGIAVHAVIYNPHFDKDATICADTIDYLRRWLATHMPATRFTIMPKEF